MTVSVPTPHSKGELRSGKPDPEDSEGKDAARNNAKDTTYLPPSVSAASALSAPASELPVTRTPPASRRAPSTFISPLLTMPMIVRSGTTAPTAAPDARTTAVVDADLNNATAGKSATASQSLQDLNELDFDDLDGDFEEYWLYFPSAERKWIQVITKCRCGRRRATLRDQLMVARTWMYLHPETTVMPPNTFPMDED